MRRGQLISLSAQGMRVQELLTTLHLHEEIATMPPRAFGQPFNQRSLRKLTDHLVGRQMSPKVSRM